jgi:hypothetical protein
MMGDLDFPEDDSCPDCGGFIFRHGPRGGAAQNIECITCKARFNVVRSYPELDPAYVAAHGWPKSIDHLSRGKIVMAERLPSEKDGGGEWLEVMFPKVLE